MPTTTRSTSRNNNKRKQEIDTDAGAEEAPSSRRRRVTLENAVPPQDVDVSSGTINNTARGLGDDANASSSKSVFEFMEDLLYSSSKVEAALEALVEMQLHLYANRAKREEVLIAGGVFLVLQVMKKYPSSKEIQTKACQLLGHLTRYHNANQKTFIKLGGVQVVLNAMKKHVSIKDVQKYSCSLLKNVASSSDETTKTVVELGAVDAIVKAMGTSPAVDGVQNRAISALVQLSYSNTGAAKIVAHKINISDVVSAMKKPSTRSDIHRHGCCLFGLLAANKEDAKNAIRGGIMAIAHAMDKYNDNYYVAKEAKAAMKHFT